MKETRLLEGLNSFLAATELLVYYTFEMSPFYRCVVMFDATDVSFLLLGFIKFLGPYYFLVITERRKIGKICGHAVYAITKSEMFPIPHSTLLSNMAYSKDENRSLVNSACKCKMSVVLLEGNIMERKHF